LTASVNFFEEGHSQAAPGEDDETAAGKPAQDSTETGEVPMSSQNVESAKKAYEAYAAGDVETAVSTFDDDIEWSIPGNSALSGSYRGKGEFIELLGKLAEKSFTTTPQRILGDGDDVVVITKTTAGGESGLQADVLTYRDGKLVKALSIADTALQERVFGTK
jgi:ketosteroid isomerase-like protein